MIEKDAKNNWTTITSGGELALVDVTEIPTIDGVIYAIDFVLSGENTGCSTQKNDIFITFTLHVTYTSIHSDILYKNFYAASSGSPDVGFSTTEQSPTGSNTFDVLDENKDKFSTLKTALDAAGITQETINGLKPITIFAPTNEAFNKLPSSLLAELLKPENKETLTKILKNHIIKNQKVEISEGMSTFGI